MSAVDPLSLQVFANLLSSVADEMGVTLQQASFSPNIKMRRDFSCALFDSHGRLLAQAAHIPVHLGAMPAAMRAARQQFELKPGDVVILNDPFAGGTHLPDISLVSAAYDDGELMGYVMSRAHHADVGGMSPGSMPLSTEIFQEGMVIPPLLLRNRGITNDPLLELILRNVRTPEERSGDLAAQIAAQSRGEAGLVALARRYGRQTVADHGRALQDYAARAMRRLVEQIEPGEYAFGDVLDSDGQSQEPVEIRVVLRRYSDSTDLVIDFSDSAPQCLGSLNAVEAVTISATLYVMRCLQAEDIPVNGGSMEPLEIIVPPGLVVSARWPAAVAGGNVETSQRIVDVLFGALAQALPDLVPAASQGTMNNLALGGFDPVRGREFAYYETMGGGMGARPGQDGSSGTHDHMSNTWNTPIEVIESEYPLRVLTYGLRSGSGGGGAFRGGDGIRRDLEFLAPTVVTMLSERRLFRPYGLLGGGDAVHGENTLIRDGERASLGGKFSRRFVAGEVLSIESPGGGGWGALPGADER